MKLKTQCYLPEGPAVTADPMIGLLDLRKGLNTILLGYLISVAAISISVGIVAVLVFQAARGQLSRVATGDASLVLFTMVLVLPLAMIASLIFVVRGKWLCLSSAPEECHAKWMMFLSILCILAGPLLNFGVFVVDDDKPKAYRGKSSLSVARIRHEIDAYKDGVPELGTHAYIKLAGQGIGMLSSVFFVLFLRALAVCWKAPLRARFAELYLVFVAVLAAGVVVLIRNPTFMLAHPRLLLGLGIGWLLAGPWYFGLILWTCIGATITLAQASAKPAPVVAKPRASSLPPLPDMASEQVTNGRRQPAGWKSQRAADAVRSPRSS